MRHIRNTLASTGLSLVLLTGLSACSDREAATAPVAASVRITNAPATLEIGESVQVQAEALDTQGAPFGDVKWTASPASVVTVSATGMVTAVSQGTGTITASAGDRTAAVTVSVLRSAVTQVTIAGLASSVGAGTSVSLNAVAKDARGATVTGRAAAWTSSEPTVAEVDQSGTLRAITPGSATVTVNVEGMTATMQVVVVPGAASSLALSPGQASIAAGTVLPIYLVARDTAGNLTAAPSATWSSSATTVATVSTSGVVTALIPGTTEITATAGGRTASAQIVVAASVATKTFVGTTNISGSHRYPSVMVPVGAALNVGPDLRLETDGDMTIDGDIAGTCSSITLVSRGRITLSGAINNPCPTARNVANAGMLRVIAAGGYTLASRPSAVGTVVIKASGHQRYTTDTLLTDADFALSALRSAVATTCTLDQASIFPATRREGIVVVSRARDGDAGQFGGNGTDGGDIVVECKGSLVFRGSVTVFSEAGGNGGDAVHVAEGNAIAIGGNGGRPGRVTVRATGDIRGDTSRNVFPPRMAFVSMQAGRSGGGRGGSASAMSTTAGGSATALGGNGGDVGSSGGASAIQLPLIVRANGRLLLDNPNPNAFDLAVWPSGAGGSATATAANGLDAGTQPAQSGGDALARGGRAGHMTAAAISAGEGTIDVSRYFLLAGNVGAGGNAIATAGNGGNGNATFRPGAPGGKASAFGGDGVDNVFIVNFGWTFSVVDGGLGGTATIAGGNAGNGYSDCSTTGGVGGAGGRGGAGAGRGGIGGRNAEGAARASAILTVNNLGNGGNGGSGATRGLPGAAGQDNTSAALLRENVGTVFSPGVVSGACPVKP
jgi:uncharacterized protein YjdB